MVVFFVYIVFPDSISLVIKFHLFVFVVSINWKIYHCAWIYYYMLFTVVKIMTKEIQRVKNILSRDNVSWNMQLVSKFHAIIIFFLLQN